MKSHIIPEFYLKQFSFKKKNAKNYVWLYEKSKDPEPRWIHRAGVVPGYFAVLLPDGTVEESFESKLATLEHDCDDVLVSARSDLFHCSERSRRKLAFYAALLHSRATQRREWTRKSWLEIHKQLDEIVADPQYVCALATHFSRKHNRRFSREQVRSDIRNVIRAHTSAEGIRNYFVKQVIEHADFIANLLLTKRIRIWKAQGPQFVTSDNPLVSFMVASNGQFAPGFGFNHSKTVGALPIAHDACLLFGGDDPSDRLYVEAEVVAEINRAVVSSADKYVYANSADVTTQEMAQDIGTYRYGETSFIPGRPMPHLRDMMSNLLNLHIDEDRPQTKGARKRGRTRSNGSPNGPSV